MTARQIIEARLGRRLCPVAVLPLDLRQAILRLGRELNKEKKPNE